MSFYAEGNLSDDLVDDPEIVPRANAMMPPLNVGNEVVIAGHPYDADPDKYRGRRRGG